MPFYLYRDKEGNVVGYNQTNGPVGFAAIPVSLEEFTASGGMVRNQLHILTDLELAQQDITDLQLSDIGQGQTVTDLELMILGGTPNV